MNIVSIRMGMKVGVTVGIGGAALYVILSGHYEQGSLTWAYATLATIAASWLRNDNAAKQ